MTHGDDIRTGAAAGRPSVAVFSDDWGRHSSSCQHLIGQLLDEWDVTWVNTIGTRPPRLDRLTLERAAGKLHQWFAPRSVADGPSPRRGPRILSPVMWPSFQTRAARRLNAALLGRALERAFEADLEGAPVGITTIPLVADLVGRRTIGRPAIGRWVYYCVDDLGEWPGLDRETLAAMERRLVERVDEIVVVSETLQRRIAAMGRDSTLLTHGVDLERWRRPAPPLPAALGEMPAPLVVFWGVIDRRLDTDWIERLAARLESGTVLLVGPTNNPDPRIPRIDRVVLPGPLPYETLPSLARAASVLVMPYADLPATRAMQPLKLKEYLATDLPVVVSALPAVGDWSDACDVVSSAEELAETVARRLVTGLPPGQAAARRRLEAETWELKAQAFGRLVLGPAATASPPAPSGPGVAARR